MKKDQDKLFDSYKQGIVDAVKSFEKKASFQSWMANDKFREKFATRVHSLIAEVRVEPTDG